jgi:cytochrome P450
MPLKDPLSLTKQETYPSPPTVSSPRLMQTFAGRYWPYLALEKYRAQYGDSFIIKPIGMPSLVLLSNPQDIRALVTAPANILHSGAGGGLMEPVFGASSFVLQTGAEHLCGRNAIMPAFHRQLTQEYASAIDSLVERTVASWPVGSAFPLSPSLGELTLKIMLVVSIGSEDSLFNRLYQQLSEMLAVMASPLLQEPLLRHLPGWRKTWRRFICRRSEANELIFAMINQRRREGLAADRDLLDMLLAATNPDSSPISDRQVRDYLVSVIVAGHETTAATLAWAFQLLAHNPVAQERLIEEIDSNAGNEYMKATIQETLRHKPTFLFLPPRVVSQPIEIRSYAYRPPTHLCACTYLLHHDPDLYPNPQAFTPERFLGTAPQAGSLLPWGAGHKRCPGRHLALLEIETVLRQTLSKLLVLPAGAHIEHPRWHSALLTPHDGAKAVLRSRRPQTCAPIMWAHNRKIPI